MACWSVGTSFAQLLQCLLCVVLMAMATSLCYAHKFQASRRHRNNHVTFPTFMILVFSARHRCRKCYDEHHLQLVALALDIEQLNIEDERGLAGDLRGRATVAVRQVRRDRQTTLLTNAHNALAPKQQRIKTPSLHVPDAHVHKSAQSQQIPSQKLHISHHIIATASSEYRAHPRSQPCSHGNKPPNSNMTSAGCTPNHRHPTRGNSNRP
jgi:hypothetical protein